ncbi:MAG: ABC transporter permease [archaeon]
MPNPIDVLMEFSTLVQNGQLFEDAAATIGRTLIGFFIACGIGIPLGLLMGYSDRIYSALEFLVEFFRSIPATALFPFFLLLFGIGDESKIALAAWTAGLVLVVNSMYGVHLGKELRIRAARTMRVSQKDLFVKIIFPEALPQIFNGMRIGISLSLIIVVVAEMFIGTTSGIGHRIVDAQLAYRVPEMYVFILLSGVIGFVLNRTFIHIENRVVHWKGK